jgi:hypothetical protein
LTLFCKPETLNIGKEPEESTMKTKIYMVAAIKAEKNLDTVPDIFKSK